MLEAIVAIGRGGRIGLNGELPWHDTSDLRWFRDMTMGRTLIVGANTSDKLPPLPGRELIIWTRENFDDLMEELKILNAVVIGGAATYKKFAPYISRWHIGRIDYDGPADTFFDRNWI